MSTFVYSSTRQPDRRGRGRPDGRRLPWGRWLVAAAVLLVVGLLCVDVYVRALRPKLGAERITTVRGMGYALGR